ncbi:cobyrinate a,c-diamide synthase [Desulfovibrio inopinatus]|uniref:cobyrinate a,c-diamide synthase n=1 Tax=Desulfovibrio inopinatus TaxID=102109 RepID=UPI000426E250|nr:cobyrinate a,c-diamide synthase [Desulfovibrio inopinatus]
MNTPPIPRLILAGLSGGSGKTIVSLGLTRALRNCGLRVKAFKKGPDYIDAAWLGLAAGDDAVNLDPIIIPKDLLPGLFQSSATGADIAIIEGNRGLFDGKDVSGSCSTAELARQLDTPVILVLDATKMTRTAAAVVQGCAHFEPGLRLGGVILNRTAGNRHRAILRETIETYTDVPVLGMLPKHSPNPIPERHMGLVSNREHGGCEAILERIATVIADHVDVDAVVSLAQMAAPLHTDGTPLWGDQVKTTRKPVIGVVRDAAFWFYYPENFEALRRAGAEIVSVSLLDDTPWPDIDGLYLGGGFPETHARALAENVAVRHRIRDLSAAGLPIYAECGGFMYLCRELVTHEGTFPMAGVFDLATTLCERPQGLGYNQATVITDNPFHPVGTILNGHEFHYSRCVLDPGNLTFCLHMSRGNGMLGQHDGLVVNNTFAAYTHIHALGAPHWAPAFVKAAFAYRRIKSE